jgi:hypothetical protein
MKKINSINSIAVILIIVGSSTLFAKEKMLVAVLDLEPKAVPRILAGAVTDIICSEMVKTGLYTIIERARMNEILKEQEFQATGCTDQTCAVQIGKLLSARKILLGEINKIGQTFIITVRIVDVEKGISEFSANEKADTEDNLDAAAKKITKNLSLNIVEGNKKFFAEMITKEGYYIRGIIPGWGQIYAGKSLKGGLYLTTFIGALAFTGYSFYNYNSKKKDYEDQKPPQSEIDKKYDAYKKAADMTLYAVIFLGVVYVSNWVDIIFFSKPVSLDYKTVTAYNNREYFNFKYEYLNNNSHEKKFTIGYGIRF